MNYTENKIKQPGELFADLCKAATHQNWLLTKEIAEELANMGAQGIWLDFAYDIADGLKKIIQISDKIFSIGNELSELQIKKIKEAQLWVAQKLNAPISTLVIELESKETPTHAVTGINGFGFIITNETDINNTSILVHEITHCNLMSKSLFLDEGLATLMQYEVKKQPILLEDDYWDRPNISSLIESDWSEDPYFSHVLPTEVKPIREYNYNEGTKVHRLAAYIVKLLIDSKGFPFLVSNWPKLKPKLKQGQTYIVIKEVFNVDLWEVEANILKKNQFNKEIKGNSTVLNIGTKALAEGNKEIIIFNLKTLRIKAYESDDNLLGLIKGLILLGINDVNKDSKYYRSEALTLMNLAINKGISKKELQFFEAYKNVFKLKGTGHAISLRKIGTQTSRSFELFLNDYPNDPEIIIATAKSQLKSYYTILPFDVWKEKLLYVFNNHPFFAKAALTLLDDPKFN